MEAVSAEAANILGARGARSLNPDLTFAELGFDSQMTVELRNRMAAVTGLQLRDTVGWDYGSITGLARYLDAELSGSAGPVQLASSAQSDEPVAVVGMACRYPGGVDSPVACGKWWLRAAMWCRNFPQTGAGIWRGCLIPTRTR